MRHCAQLLFFALLAALVAVPSAALIDGIPTEVFPGIMTAKYAVLRNAVYPNGDHIGVQLSVLGDQFSAIGFSKVNMAGPIVACHVSDGAKVTGVCTNVIGINGGGIHSKLPPQTAQVLSASIEPSGFRTIEFAVPVSALNLSSSWDRAPTRLIFAHGHWDAKHNLPTYHGPHNATIVPDAELNAPVSSPEFELFPDRMNFQWKISRNSASAGGDALVGKLAVKGDYYAAVGFAPYIMGGPIVACHVTEMNVPTCKNLLGHFHGGIHSQLPAQTVKVLWSAVEGEWRSVGFEVPLSSLNLTSPMSSLTRMIFAHGHWVSGLPTYHGPNNATYTYANLYTTELAANQTLRTVANTISFSPDQSPELSERVKISWSVQFNGTYNNSYLLSFFEIKGDYWGAMGFAPQGMAGHILMCYSSKCYDFDGYDYGIKLAANQVSQTLASFTQGNTTYFQVLTPLNRANIGNHFQRAIFATSTWDGKKNMPNPHNAKGHFDTKVNFFTNAVAASADVMHNFQVFPGKMTAAWRLIDSGVGYHSIVIHLSVKGDYDEYMAIGFSKYNMHGHITACHVPVTDATGVVCTDVNGHNGGGVSRANNQYSAVISSSRQNGFSDVTFVVPLFAVNMTLADALNNDTRLIFAHGHWNASSDLPTYHGSHNATILKVNLASGKTSSTGASSKATAITNVVAVDAEKKVVVPTASCLPVSLNAASARLHCDGTTAMATVYLASRDCTGFSVPVRHPTLSCAQVDAGLLAALPRATTLALPADIAATLGRLQSKLN